MAMSKVFKFGAEVSGFIFVGNVVSQFITPSDEYYKRLKNASKPVFEQSHSLTAEYYSVMSKIEAAYYGRLRAISQRAGATSKDIRKGDLDELCKNLTNEDPHVDSITELFEEKMPANHGHIFKIVEKYRLIPPQEMTRLLKLIGGEKGGERKKSSVEEILESVNDVTRLAHDVTNNFDTQQERLQKALTIKVSHTEKTTNSIIHFSFFVTFTNFVFYDIFFVRLGRSLLQMSLYMKIGNGYPTCYTDLMIARMILI